MSHSNEVAGLTELRRGFLYLIISYVIAIVGGVTIVAMAFTSILFVSSSSALSAILPFIIGGALTVIIALALNIYALFVKIRSGFRYLSQVDAQFGISYTGTTLMIVGLVIVVVGIIALIATIATYLPEITAYTTESLPLSLYDYLLSGTAIASVAVLILGAIIAAIGEILTFIIGAFRLHGRYNESLYLVAGILYIVAIIAAIIGSSGGAGGVAGSIFSLIAAILMYMALGTTINKLATR